MILNLLDNSVKFTDREGKIYIKAVLLPVSNSIRDSKGGKKLEISIADNGIGMREEE